MDRRAADREARARVHVGARRDQLGVSNLSGSVNTTAAGGVLPVHVRPSRREQLYDAVAALADSLD